MDDERQGIRTAEKLAGVVAIVAALVVLNGAWVNQHNWENVSWRIAVAAVLIVLAVAVETNLFGRLRERGSDEGATVPDFMRVAADARSQSTIAEGTEPSTVEAATTAERH